MKTLLIFTLAIGSFATLLAQEVPQQQTISQLEPHGTITDRAAIDHILATNTVEWGAVARYRAGRSILLQPGFMAQAGSVFQATIQAVSATREASSELTVRAYPNPFSDQTTVEYTLPQSGWVRLSLLDASGQSVQQTGKQQAEAGLHTVFVYGQSLPAATYLYRVQTATESKTVRLLKQ